MKESTECPIDRNMPQRGHPWRRWGSGLVYFLVFCVLSAGCLLWALGYRVNWTAQTVERTGIIELSTPQAGLNPDVFVNGDKQSSGLPLTLRWLFPGHYDISVQLSGYQTWDRQISVDANQLVSYPGILLLYSVPRIIDVPSVRADEIINRQYNNSGIEIRSGNELWANGQFITRTSDDIINPEYFFDDKHVIYQTGQKLTERDLVSGTSEDLVTLTANAPTPYVTQSNGRILVYLENNTLKAVELYQSVSIIDRLGVSR